jgi:class 3 adenylate cyclase
VFRYGGSPGTFEALDQMNMGIDIREVLSLIRVPTLVLHQSADPSVRVEHGRYLAQHIPGAAYVELDGKVAGIAVSIGARISAQAAADQVLVSQTVKDLVTGSGITFEDRGVQQLEGVPGE